mmetsp:Transcript_16548/g.28939  ORF Transcript_16548/g.28939 Transcript_16548/m.28939 type:complete len:283 (-) Transcript_16548:90-938(-)
MKKFATCTVVEHHEKVTVSLKSPMQRHHERMGEPRQNSLLCNRSLELLVVRNNLALTHHLHGVEVAIDLVLHLYHAARCSRTQNSDDLEVTDRYSIFIFGGCLALELRWCRNLKNTFQTVAIFQHLQHGLAIVHQEVFLQVAEITLCLWARASGTSIAGAPCSLRAWCRAAVASFPARSRFCRVLRLPSSFQHSQPNDVGDVSISSRQFLDHSTEHPTNSGACYCLNPHLHAASTPRWAVRCGLPQVAHHEDHVGGTGLFLLCWSCKAHAHAGVSSDDISHA